MKQIQILVVASMLLVLAVPAWAASATSPIHVNNRLRIGWDDNVYQVDSSSTTGLSKQDSFRIIEEVEALVSLNFERTYLGLRYRPSLIWYSDRDDSDTEFLNDLDLNFIHNFSPTLSLSLSDTLRSSQLPELQDSGYVVRQDDDNIYNAAIATLSYTLRPETRIDLSGRYIILEYTESDYQDASGAQVSHDNDNYYSVVGGLTLRHQLASLTTLMVDGRYQSLVYGDADEANNRDADSFFGGLGLEQTFSPQMIGSFRAGVEHRVYDNDRFDDETRPYGEASLTFMPSPATRLTGSASYSLYESDVSNYLSQERLYAALSLAHDFTAKLSFYLSGAYTLNAYEAKYSLIDGVEDEDENTFLVSMRMSYRVNRINWLEAGYQFVMLDSDVLNRESYERNRVDVGWKIQLF
ncbi:MAG: outer membrane beta-barrel protein [Kiritimatiellae bacterium]|nr:outer membrane beta-barrel protein [Kiritimatiellia bacterium]